MWMVLKFLRNHNSNRNSDNNNYENSSSTGFYKSANSENKDKELEEQYYRFMSFSLESPLSR